MLKPSKDRLAKALWWQKNWRILDGCTKVSPGCKNCFAEDYAKRFASTLPYLNGLTDDEGNWTGKVNISEDLLDLPINTKKPTVWFVAERSDLFHEAVPDSFIHDALNAIGSASHHTFLLLTKRPDRMEDILFDHYQSKLINPYTNLWIGTTAENQLQADKRIPFLLKAPAAKRFLSIEPMLGHINITKFHKVGGREGQTRYYTPEIDWVICGCESGTGARPMKKAWAVSLMAQCRVAGIPFFFKQMVIDGKIVKAPKLYGKEYLQWPDS